VRIEQLELSRYGCFTDRVLDLSGPGVHLVVGPNEAGKSTIRRAFADLLYGIPERTTLGFLHDMRELRISARLRGGTGPGEGALLDLVRLKQRKAPLQTPDGEPLAESALAALLSGIDRAQFESTFAIDHEELRRGGRQLLAGEGDLGAALFETSTNRQLTGLLDSIDEQMGRLFKRNAQLPAVNATLSRIGEARKRLDGSLLRPADYDRVARAKNEAGKLRDQLREEVRLADTEYARLKRTLETKPLLADLARLQQERADQATTLDPALGAQIADQSAAIRERASASRLDVERATGERESVADKLADLVVDDRMLAAATEIEQLHSDRKAVQEAEEQAARERKRADKARDQARALLGSGRSDGLAGTGPSNRDRADALRAALAGVRAAELLPMASDKAKQVAKLERAVRTLRDKHGLPDTVSDWPPVPVPAREQVTAFKEKFAEFDDQLRDLARHRQETARSYADNQRDLAAVLAGDPPPSETDLAEARAARDAAWLDLRGKVLTVESGAAFDAAVRRADSLADRMRREAQRQTDRVRLEVAAAADEQALETLDVRLGELDRQREEAHGRWAAAWRPSGLPAPDPNAATELLAGIEALIGKAEELADTQVDLNVCRAEIKAAESRLRQVLGYVGTAPNGEDQSTDTATSAESEAGVGAGAEGVVDAASAGASVLAGAGLAELVALADQRRAEYEAAGTQREKADTLLAEADDLASGAAAKAERVAQFADSVATVAAACGATISDSDAYAAIGSLRGLLQEAQRNSTVAGELRKRDAELETALAAARAATDRAANDLAELISSAGVEDELRLDALVERAAAAADLDRRISALTSPLAQTGVPLATLVLEASEWPDLAELANRVAVLNDAREERQAELQAASEEFGSRRNELDAMDGSPAAAEAAERLAEHQAVLIEHSEEYLRLYLGKQVLLQCVEEYRQANQDPVLARARELFAVLTNGRFTELLADQDGHGRDVLRVRRAGGAGVAINGDLSEGTLDQVYLALRLAALQRFADADRTMPLVFDDIFITSDDERTAAGLSALDAIADRFQVVVFTHHGHIGDLARKALPAGRVHITGLPASAS
jgi:uncharacterized protein YhaN